VWREFALVKTFVSSGMSAAASVPHEMMLDSFHHSPPPRSDSIHLDTTYVTAIDRIEVSHTSVVSGASKSILSLPVCCERASDAFSEYDTIDVTIIRMRITKIHTSSCALCSGITASAMKLMSATPVTPYVSKPSAVGPTESPALSPVQSAITPGLRGSSSLILKTTFMRSEPMSAIFVKMPPAMRSAEAPSDSPMAKPRNDAPAASLGTNSRMMSIMISSTQIRSTPMLMPACSGISYTWSGLPLSDANAVRLFAYVFMRMPNHATEYEPRMPTIDHMRMSATLATVMCWSTPK